MDGADDGELRTHAKSDEHHEEHDGPQWRHRKSRNHFRVNDESQTGTCNMRQNVRSLIFITIMSINISGKGKESVIRTSSRNLINGNLQLVRHKTDDAEDDESSEE